MIVVIVLSVNLIGEGIRNAFDPRNDSGARLMAEPKSPSATAPPEIDIEVGDDTSVFDSSQPLLSVSDLNVTFKGTVHAVRGV